MNQNNRVFSTTILAGLLLISPAIEIIHKPPIVRAQTTEELNAEADRLFNEGYQLFQQGTAESLQQAIAKCQQALPLYQQLGDKYREALTSTLLGRVHSHLGFKPEALEYLNQALTLIQAVGDTEGEAIILNNIGGVYSDLGEKQQALHYYEQALPLRRALGDTEGEARTLNNIGLVYSDLGENPRALEYLNQALPLFRAMDDKGGEATTLTNIGAVYSDLGEKQQALDYYQQALSLFRAVGDRRGEASTLNHIGAVYSALGEKQQALDYYEQALPLRRAVGDRAGEATTLNNIGGVYDDLGEKQQALDYYEQALPLSRAVGDRAGEATTLNNIGGVYDDLGEKQQALDYYEQALPLSRAVGDRTGEARTLSNIGVVYDALGEKQQALDYYEQALPLRRAVSDRAGEATTLNNIAYLERDRGNLTEALTQINAAIDLIEALRSNIINPDLRQSYFSTVQGAYQLKIDILMQLHQEEPNQGYDVVALETSENSRARVLAELLTEANLDIRKGVDPDLLAEEKRLNQQLSAVEKQRQDLVSGPNDSPEDLDRIIAERDNILKQLSDLETKIRSESPEYANIKYPEPITLEEIQQNLDENTLLLEYALGRDRSYLFLVGQNSFSTYQLPPGAEINAAIEKYLEPFHSDDEKVLNSIDIGSGKELSEILLSPIADKLKNQRLVIVGNGKLQLLPFAALPISFPSSEGLGVGFPSSEGLGVGSSSREGLGVGFPSREGLGVGFPSREGLGVGSSSRDGLGVGTGALPLLVNHEIINLPSFGSLIVQRQKWQNRPAAPKTFAVIADPIFGPSDYRLEGIVASPNQDLSELPGLRQGCNNLKPLNYTETEAKNILAQVPDDREFSALGFDATRAVAISPELQHYQMVHFATHGCIEDNPLLSGLAFTRYDKQGNSQDSFLRLQDIFNLELNAELLVLSACETGIGENVSGEGIVGFTRGFMYAGAKRITVSLWAIFDQSTSIFMNDYYQNMLGEQLNPIAALRAAQLEMWQSGTWQSPYYWAAFTIQGDW